MAKEKYVKIAGQTFLAGADDYTTPPAKATGDEVKRETPDFTKEHQTLCSRITGKHHEIGFGPLPGGLVPSNPFASEKQRAYLNMHPEKLGPTKLEEFNKASKGLKLPKKVK